MANELTPMMQQYLDFKNQYQDELLFYRSGDFYELFFEDAKTASRELGLTLTGRNGGLEERIPMCGVPYHSVEPGGCFHRGMPLVYSQRQRAAVGGGRTAVPAAAFGNCVKERH